MSLFPRKKSSSWHQKTASLEQRVSALVSANNKSIFSEILTAKLSNHSSYIKPPNPFSSSKDSPILEQNSSFSSHKKKYLNQSFSRFSKCNCCGFNSFYEQQRLNDDLKEMLRHSKGKSLLALEIAKIKNFSINDLAQQTKALKSPSDVPIDDKIKETVRNKENSLEKFPILTQQNYYHDFVPQEKEEEIDCLKSFFAKTSKQSKKPIENTFIQAMLSLKKELPTAFSNKSMNRREIVILRHWFANQEEILNKRTFQNLEEKTNAYFELYSLCLTEVIKEISVECNEKGEIINEIWQKFLELLAGHRVYVEQEERKIKESSQILIDTALNKERLILEKTENTLKAKIEEIAEIKRNDREFHAKMKQMEQSNKTYWEDGNKYRYLCKTLNDKYVNLKKDFQNLQEKVYRKTEFEVGKTKPDIYINSQTPDQSLLNTPKPQPNKFQMKFKEETNINISKEETPSSNNLSDIPSLGNIKAILSLREGEGGSQQNVKVPPQLRSIFQKTEEQVEKNEGLLKPATSRKLSMNEKLFTNENKLKEIVAKKFSLPKTSSPIKVIIKLPNNEVVEKKEDTMSDSKESFLSNLEICEEEKNQITIKELNGLVKMVHPDKFQVALLENSTQIESDLYDSWHHDVMIQTNTFLLESKYDPVFSTNKDVQEFLNDYSQKKEIQQLFHQKNLQDLENCESAGRNVNELIEESLQSAGNLAEIKELLIDSPNEKKNIEFNENDVPFEQLKQAMDLTNVIINSPVLKYKTMTKTKELMLKIMRVYMKENSKNIVFGNEIRHLNELLGKEKIEREDLELRYNELVKKIENYPLMMSMSQSKLMNNDSEYILDADFNIDEDEKDEKEGVSAGNKKKRIKAMANGYQKEERTEWKMKNVNPGIQLIQQIKNKNLAKFQNILSPKMIYKIIYQIYQDRITLIKENPKMKEVDCPSFSYNFFIKCYGFRKMAQQKFILFLLSLKKTITQLRINVFAKLLGLLQTPMNYNLEEFNQYIFGLDFVTNSTLANNSDNIQNPTIGTVNKETDARFMVNFMKSIEFAKILEKECESNEYFQFKKEVETIREEDSKNYLKAGIVDFDMFMSKYLVFFRKIKNQGKKNLVLAFRSADLNFDGLVDLFEFGLVIKWLEKEMYDQQKKEGLEKLFKENADVIINSDEKHMSFNNFCCFCEEFSLFEAKKMLKFIDLDKEEDGGKAFSGFVENLKNKNTKLLNMIELLDGKEFWTDVCGKLEKKLEKAQNDEKLKIPTLVSFRMIEREVEDLYKIKTTNL